MSLEPGSHVREAPVAPKVRVAGSGLEGDEFGPQHCSSRVRSRPTLRLRWLRIRARLSIPALLSGMDERSIVSLTAGINGGLAILVISVFAWLIDLPLLFPALGPTAFILFSAPFSRAAAPRSVILGHFIGIGCGWLAWQATGVLSGSPVGIPIGGWPLYCSGATALALTGLLLVRARCPHPPACASALVIALGGVSTWMAVLAMALAVVLVTAQGVGINRLAGVRVPLWASRSEELESLP